MSVSSVHIAKIKKIKGVAKLVSEIRDRQDNGHYDFMSSEGKARLWSKLNEYENYAKTVHSGKKLRAMEAELQVLLGSTY